MIAPHSTHNEQSAESSGLVEPELFESAPDVSLSGARAAVVNRTHRVVRERAAQMQKRRGTLRDLAVPLLICSTLLLMLTYAAWTMFSSSAVGFGTELEEQAGKLLNPQLTDTGGPGYVLFLWFLPVSAVALGTVLLRRSRERRDDEVSR